MDFDIFSQNLGYISKTSYSLKYFEHHCYFSYKWPPNHVLNQVTCENVFENIICQNVGVDRSFIYRDVCSSLKLILDRFLKKHQKTDYRKLLQKCQIKSRSKNQRSTPRCVVKEYIHRIIFSVIPLLFFGTKMNAVQFERNFRRIFYLGKHQVFSLEMILRKIKVKNLPYLRFIDGYINKTNLFAKLFLWLIRVYLLSAIKCVFHVTESNHSNKYMFYEKRIWKKIQHRRLKKIKKEVLGIHKHCLVKGIVKSEHLYTIKLLPKRRSSRPIFIKLGADHEWKMKCNLARKTAEILLGRFAEKYFENVHSSWNVFHEKWLSLYNKWNLRDQCPVYYVRTDFVDAFASTNLNKLLEIISKIREGNKNSPNLVFKHQGWLKTVPLQSAFKILENYSRNFIFKHCDKVYRLTGGLCQGGPLSCQLYNLYLGEWEQLFLSEYVKDDIGFFIRNCDDCLYVTMDHGKASNYLRLIEEGFSEFNLNVNLRKTETNIRDESIVTVSFGSYVLDVQTFQIYGCYEFCRDLSIFHSSRLLSVESPGRLIFKRFVRPCMLKLNKVFLDSTYNTVQTILYNVFMSASVSAAKSIIFMKRLFTHFNDRFIMSCFLTCSIHVSKAVHNALDPNVGINREIVQWIVMKAFLIRLEGANTKNFENISTSIRGFLRNSFKRMDEQQREIISPFFHINPSSPLRSLV